MSEVKVGTLVGIFGGAEEWRGVLPPGDFCFTVRKEELKMKIDRLVNKAYENGQHFFVCLF